MMSIQKLTLCIISILCSIQLLAQEGKDFNLEKCFNRSINDQERDKVKQDIYDYSQMIRENPNEAIYYLNRGVSYATLGLYPDAINDYNAAIKINAGIPEAFYNRGLARARFAYTKAACVDIKKSAEMGLGIAGQVYENKCGLFKEDLGEIVK
jgi:tetratricopeptide (TPR) repeat protein